jgi:hypothetical protein
LWRISSAGAATARKSTDPNSCSGEVAAALGAIVAGGGDLAMAGGLRTHKLAGKSR